MRFKMKTISKSALYRVTFLSGFHYGLNVRYQTNVNTTAGNHLIDAFVKQHGAFEEQLLLIVLL